MIDSDNYPEKGVYRGISSTAFFTNDSRTLLKSDVFKFDAVEDRIVDELAECSVNWADDEGALLQIARQTTTKRDGADTIQFVGGACRIALADLEFVKKSYDRLLSWERSPIPAVGNDGQNPYHGNLLSISKPKGEAKQLVREMRSNLATIASRTEILSREALDALMMD
jgi:hypothetical protein